MFNQFKDFVLDSDQADLYYHFFKFGLTISAKVEKVESYFEDGIKITFEGGHITIAEKNKVRKVHQPAMWLVECEECYDLFNEYDDHIGCVLKPK